MYGRFFFLDNGQFVAHNDQFACCLFSKVSLLHAALEQERSKVKGLQSDQPKHQVRGQIHFSIYRLL